MRTPQPQPQTQGRIKTTCGYRSKLLVSDRERSYGRVTSRRPRQSSRLSPSDEPFVWMVELTSPLHISLNASLERLITQRVIATWSRHEVALSNSMN